MQFTNTPFCLFQPPVDYDSLQVTRIHNIQTGWQIFGMCYFSGMLYTTEGQEEAECVEQRVAVYSVTVQDNVTLLDTLHLEEEPWPPRIDCQSGRVYFSCQSRGIYVVKYDGRKLLLITILTCAGRPGALTVVSPHTLYVSDWYSNNVCLVDVTQDRVTARLQNPVEVAYSHPWSIAVLGDTVLVETASVKLLTYRHGVPTQGKLLPKPQGLEDISSLTTDHHSSFLLVDDECNTVFVLDISGNLTHTISIPRDKRPRDCTVVGGHLWVGCVSGSIIVMSSQ